MSQQHRSYVYGIVIAAIPLLVAAGFITSDDAQLWLNVAAAVLGLGAAGLAKPNANPKKVDVVPRDAGGRVGGTGPDLGTRED